MMGRTNIFKVALFLPILSACSAVHFNQLPSVSNASNAVNAAPSAAPSVAAAPTASPSPSASQCVPKTVESITRMTKIIFVVDTSGSNALKTRDEGTLSCLTTDVDYATCTPPTDPTKSFRGGAIQNFLNQYGKKTNFDWGFMTFAGTVAHSLINQNGNDQLPLLSANPLDLQSAIDAFYNITDTGATPYQSALQMVTDAVTNDADLNSPADPQYFMILLTDGFPTDYGDPATGFDIVSLNNDVNTLLASAPGRVSLSTIYYGQVNDPNAIALLQRMATQGNGQFASVNDTSTGIKIDDVIPGVTTTCP